jgi:selenocysteine-specific elongation factor
MPTSSDTLPVTVGTAGHIDHGKTLLVERLTGMRADRPYERERGMTIDIGYAEMRAPDGRRIGFVDLPGHERFVRNMVAGATGVDLALLVVAADDGVMPQTREHVQILGLLGVRRGLAVLNKIDLVDEETRLLAAEELREFLRGSVFAEAPVFPVSAATGEGVGALRDAILAEVAQVPAREDPGAFFLAIQRSFAAPGFGCIVTGVPSAGSVAVGDEVELLPPGRRARVRSIEIYHEPADRARAGHRTALNLAGVHHHETARGMVVAAPGVYRASRHVAARLRLLSHVRKGIRHASLARFLTGTLEQVVAVYLLEGDALLPGAEAIVELRAAEPVAARDGDAFILRSENSSETLGGGRVLEQLENPIGRRDRALHERLRRWSSALDDPRARLREAIEGGGGATPAALAARAKLTRDATEAILAPLLASGELVALSGGVIAPRSRVESARASLLDALAAMHRERPLLEALPVAEVRDRAGLDEALLGAAIEAAGAEVAVTARTLRLAKHAVRLDESTAGAAEIVLRRLREARFAPPERDALPAAAGLPAASVEKALTFLLDRGAVRQVAPGLLYPKETLDEGLRLLRAVAKSRGSFEPLEAKTVFGGISRKWLIPLLEYYDRIGATRRDGNRRIVTRRGDHLADSGID